jgi:hypothetical protein
MQITIEVPDRLGEQLQQLGDRLPEALDLVLQGLTSTETTGDRDERQIIELLASQPSPEEVLAIHPSPALQTWMSELLLVMPYSHPQPWLLQPLTPNLEKY